MLRNVKGGVAKMNHFWQRQSLCQKISLVGLVPGVQSHVDFEAVLGHEALAALCAVVLGCAVGGYVQLQPPLRGARPLANVTSVPAMVEYLMNRFT